MTVTRRIRRRGEHDISRKTTAQGMPECSVCTCMLVCVFLCALCTRDRGCSVHLAFPAPSDFEGVKITAQLGRMGVARMRNRIWPSLPATNAKRLRKGAKRRSNPFSFMPRGGLLRFARNDGHRTRSSNERSDIRDHSHTAPGYRYAHPGYGLFHCRKTGYAC